MISQAFLFLCSAKNRSPGISRITSHFQSLSPGHSSGLVLVFICLLFFIGSSRCYPTGLPSHPLPSSSPSPTRVNFYGGRSHPRPPSLLHVLIQQNILSSKLGCGLCRFRSLLSWGRHSGGEVLGCCHVSRKC